MNAQRRKELNKIQDLLTVFKDKLESLRELHSELESIKGALEGHRDDEQEGYDNMPESFQNGERGQLAQDAISAMENSINAIDEVIPSFEVDNLTSTLDGAFDYIEEAKGVA